MKKFDAAVIGGGILGCFAARCLRKWEISTLLIEAEKDVCRGITKANSAIVYAGYDNRPGSLKAEMTLRGNSCFAELCRELDVPFSRCGSIMVSFSEEGDAALKKKLAAGTACGVPGLRFISGAEAKELEPMLADGISLALHAPSTGTVNPWQLGIAAYENALKNGCHTAFGSRLIGISRDGSGYVLQTEKEEYFCKAVINCAGAASDRVHELLFEPSVRLFCDGADFLVMDKNAPKPGRIIFHQDALHGKGITAIPTVEGNLLLGPSRRPITAHPTATSKEGLDFLREDALRILPGLDMAAVIRSFAGTRPNPHRVVFKNGEYIPDGSSIGSFVIERPEEAFISLIGIKTPGITCAGELGMYAAESIAAYLGSKPNGDFDPIREGIRRPYDSHVLCRCEGISEAEVREAIMRGARDFEAVKRRVGSGMGACQGSRCRAKIERMLEEYRNGTL